MFLCVCMCACVCEYLGQVLPELTEVIEHLCMDLRVFNSVHIPQNAEHSSPHHRGNVSMPTGERATGHHAAILCGKLTRLWTFFIIMISIKYVNNTKLIRIHFIIKFIRKKTFSRAAHSNKNIPIYCGTTKWMILWNTAPYCEICYILLYNCTYYCEITFHIFLFFNVRVYFIAMKHYF